MENALRNLAVALALTGVLLCLIGVAIRLLNLRQHNRKAELLICIAAGALLWHALVYVMIYTGVIRAFPNLYNKGIPFYYLIGPATFYATQFSLFPHSKYPKYWWLHLLPFVLGVIDVMPYAMAPLTEKQALLDEVVQDMKMGVLHQFGYIDQKWHYILRFFLAFVYLMAQWRLIYVHDGRFSPLAPSVKSYMVWYACFYSLHLLMQTSLVLSLLFNQLQSSFIMRDVYQVIWVSLFYFVFSLWIFISALYRPLGSYALKDVQA
ncbi:hypothetical protein [Sphingobacterium griseoflavum]|uniref:Uncharacterized protein n=1 Tax=Sphingobacterium griseoflavum TaxID=1474952 RepID=A0ABQ3I1A9_9SPHI|nr:hypothetical protein [Sphingobacterium griseoflavum]GHE39905.1 hypothetical protein GCM10017764_24060 [Sphingobacterium griseoflavum]